jgi:putative FmdB family regulatory protein
MPIYEYQCQKCGLFEYSQRITDNPIRRCPTCGSKVTRIISRTSFVLKGSGWYVTDYARDGSKQPGASTDSKAAGANEAAKPASASGESRASSTDSGSSTKSSGKTEAATTNVGQQ